MGTSSYVRGMLYVSKNAVGARLEVRRAVCVYVCVKYVAEGVWHRSRIGAQSPFSLLINCIAASSSQRRTADIKQTSDLVRRHARGVGALAARCYGM